MRGNRFELLPAAKAALESLTSKYGMTQLAVISRLVAWFNEQSAEVNGGILSGFKLSQAERKELMRQIAKSADVKATGLLK